MKTQLEYLERARLLARLPVESVALADEVFDRYEFHRQGWERGSGRSKRSAWILRIAIPLYSATLSALAPFLLDLPSPQGAWVAGALAYGLTVLTVMNSILAPAERYSELCKLLIKLHDWEMQLRGDLEKALCSPSSGVKAAVAGVLQKADAELSRMGSDVLPVLVPKAPESGSGGQ